MTKGLFGRMFGRRATPPAEAQVEPQAESPAQPTQPPAVTSPPEPPPAEPPPEVAVPPSSPEMYEQLRSMALAMTSRELGFLLPQERSAYGAVMDWSSANWTATVAAFITGDVSLYLSHGGGVLGGGGHANVREAGIEFVRAAEALLDGMQPAGPDFPRPPAETCRFWVLTNHGVFTAEDEVAAFASGASPLATLGSAAQKALYLLRTTQAAAPADPQQG